MDLMQPPPESRRRKLRTWRQGEMPSELRAFNGMEKTKSLLDIASNDYLGLSNHPKLIEAAQSTMNIDGVGAGASRLITGSRPIHQELENELANWLGRESALLFPSGFQANIAAVISLADRHTIVIADKFIHHSLLLGVKASGAQLKRFSHNNIEDLEIYLKRYRKQNSNQKLLVITESLFSMEGTNPSIKKIARVCERYDAKLLVDEAHAIGVMGSQGRGLCFGISENISLISGTFGKAFGSGGAFLASSKIFREHLLQTSGGFRYTTALAPPLAGASLAALNLIKDNPQWIIDLQKRSINWRTALTKKGWVITKGDGPIIPLIIGKDEKTMSIQNKLEKAGLLTVAIRPPTVPEGQSRLRIVLRRTLPKGTLCKLIQALDQT